MSNPYKAKSSAKRRGPAKPVEPVVPTGTIKEILEWVGEDKEKAKSALEAENKRDNPRSTLVDDLEDVLDDNA